MDFLGAKNITKNNALWHSLFLKMMICLLSADAFRNWRGESSGNATVQQTLSALVWGGFSNEPN